MHVNLNFRPNLSEAPARPVPVLHVINGEHYSGAERVQDLLGQRLGEFGFEVGFACLKLGRFAALRQAREVPMFDVPMRWRFDMRPALALVNIIRKHQYEIIHTHTARSALVGRMAARITGVSHVHHVHSPTMLDSTRWLTNRLNSYIERISLRHAAGVIAVSHSLGEYVRKQRLGSGLTRVVPNGVPPLGPLLERPAPHDTWTLGTVALFRPRKGLEVLLETLAQLRQRGLQVRLRAVGAFETDEYELQIKQLAAKLGLERAVDWTGFTRNVVGELGKMDLFVLPSLFGEGLPMVILEAMSAGVPIVATRIEGVPEAIRDGIDGVLAAPGNAQDLAQRITDVIQGKHHWQSLRHNAHQRQAQDFSDRSMAAGVAETYRRVLEATPTKTAWTKVGGHSVPIRSSGEGHPVAICATATSVHSSVALAPAVQAELKPYEHIRLLGTRIDNVTMDQAIGLILQRFQRKSSTQVCFVNADCSNLAAQHSDYSQTLEKADLVFADGIGMKIAGHVLGQPVLENVNGTDLFPRLCMALVGSGKRIYLLGAQPGVAEAVGHWVSSHFHGIEVCGTRDGYFKPHEEHQVVAEISATRPDVLLVALGAPHQDLWLNKHLTELNCKVAMGVGGLFDFFSGRIPRAPKWMRSCGLEWLFRLIQEPRRLAYRYLVGNPRFLWRVFQAYRRQLDPRNSQEFQQADSLLPT